jgi:seryl-tRNA synthetase
MLDIKFIRQNKDLVRQKLTERGQVLNLDEFIRLEEQRRNILQEVEALRNERNTVSKQVGEKKKRQEDATELIARMGDVSTRIKELDETLAQTEENLHQLVMMIPNLPHESVVFGQSSDLGREKGI